MIGSSVLDYSSFTFSLIFWYLFLPYIFYLGVIKIYICYYHYITQKDVISVGFPLPFLGNVYLAALPVENNENKMPYIKVLESRTGGIKQNKTVFGFAA